MPAKRLTYLDTVSGLLLIYMIVFHACQFAGYEDIFIRYTLPLSVFMPWFFFKSGMFYRHQTTKDIAERSFRRLIIPYIAFSSIALIVYWVKQLIIYGGLSYSDIIFPIRSFLISGTIANQPLWFLVSLYVVRVLYNYIQPKRNCWIYILIICSVAFVTHYTFEYIQHIMPEKGLLIQRCFPYYISNISSGLLMYTLGDKMRNYSPNLMSIIIITLVYLGLIIAYPTYLFMYTNTMYAGCYLLWPVYALLGIISLNGISRVCGDRINILSKIGKETIPYYCMHWIVLMIVSSFFSKGILLLVIELVCYCTILPSATYAIRKSKFKFILG